METLGKKLVRLMSKSEKLQEITDSDCIDLIIRTVNTKLQYAAENNYSSAVVEIMPLVEQVAFKAKREVGFWLVIFVTKLIVSRFRFDDLYIAQQGLNLIISWTHLLENDSENHSDNKSNA